MESTNNKNNQLLYPCEFKELRNEISTMKKRIVQLEESHEKQQERLEILERENQALKKKTQLNNLDDNTAGGSTLKRNITEKDQDNEEEPEKKTKTNNNNNDDDEAVLLPQHDNGDSFDSLSDDLLHKIVEFYGNCYSKFGLINKRCKNIYDVKEYKLKKETCVFGYGTVDMMLQHFLQKRKEGSLDDVRHYIAAAMVSYNRLDAVDWIIQLEDIDLVIELCFEAVYYKKINILSRVFCKSHVTMLDELLNHATLCDEAALNGNLETLKWLRKYGAYWNASTFSIARDNGDDEMVQYLSSEGCPEPSDDEDEPSVLYYYEGSYY